MSKRGKSAKSSKKENIKWTEQMDNVFIDTMLEQQARGFRVDDTFTSTAYKNMLSTCVEAFGIALSKDQLKNKIKTLKTNFSTCHELFKNKSGIAWSNETKIFEADDQVWDDLISANPLMRRWRNTPVYNYDKLDELFSKNRATGSMSTTCNELIKMWSKNNQVDESVLTPKPEHDTLLEKFDETNPPEISQPPPDRALVEDFTPGKNNKRKSTAISLQEIAMSKLDDTNEQLQEMVKCMKHANETMDKQLARENCSSMLRKKFN